MIKYIFRYFTRSYENIKYIFNNKRRIISVFILNYINNSREIPVKLNNKEIYKLQKQ